MNKVKYSHKVIAFFLALNILQSIIPYNMLYASNNGPNAPEASGFESANATDMVNLSSGDMAYVLPVMDVGGLPISLSYHGGIPLDLESTWTGLGWNLNTGAINRSLNATPDDWSGGNSVDFIRYSHAETVYSVNVGVGISKTAEVGVGASWGSNKTLSGSVFASVGFEGHFGASASISTDGNYSLGVSAGTGTNGQSGQSFGGGIGISGNINGGKTSVGIGVGVRSADGMTMGLGASLDGGMSASMGYNNGGGNTTQSGASASLSSSSFSSGDWEISSKGWYVPIIVPYFSFGFGKQKITYSLRKGYQKKGYGILYGNLETSDPNNDAVELNNGVDNQFLDYQHRFRYIDSYDQTIPMSQKEFVGDYDAEREKLNFTFASYDAYEVNATGISGVMSPKILQNSTVYGLGYTGSNPNDTNNGKLRIYNHNSLTTSKTFGKSIPSDIEFYFNGHFTQNKIISPMQPVAGDANSNSLQNFISPQVGSVTPSAVQNHNRLKQGEYIEVFTNKQIKEGYAAGLLSPLNPNANGLLEEALNRNSPEYKDKGIGGYKITSPDGKVYHFSQPVYHFEQVDRTILKNKSEEHVSEKRQYTSYATHWLLTAITGPDFVDTNNNNIADVEDYGYWVRMDYGKWSDGYVWRTPTDKNLVDFNTNIEGKVFEEDFGNYQFGRKQLYYLDRVVSATHTAYFVKDLRYDSVGSDLNYKYNATTTSINGIEDITIDNSGIGGGVIVPKENFTYKPQLQLKLNKIILVRNEEAIVSKGDSNAPLQLNSLNVLNDLNGSNYVKNYTLPFMTSGGFYAEYGQPTININNESGVYDVRDFDGFDYNDAIKIVDFNYTYDLAVKNHADANSKGSPGTVLCSANPRAGKLCLKQVKFLGRNNFDYMPPYRFEYDGEYMSNNLTYTPYPSHSIIQRQEGIPGFYVNNQEITLENLRAKDEWGFLKERPQAWTMTRIITPTGANIDFEHEEDDYYTEAFSNRYWSDNLMFKATKIGNTHLSIEVRNEQGLMQGLGVDDFTKYFWANQQVFLDLWMARAEGGTNGADSGKVDINANNKCVVTEVTTEKVVIMTERIFNNDCTPPGDWTVSNCTLWGDGQGLILNSYFGRTYTSSGSNLFYSLPRGRTPHVGSGLGENPDHWTVTYKLLANKVPIQETGGGLRVKSITLKDENNNKYKTRYYYNTPIAGGSVAGLDKTNLNYKSSGITSYAPVRGTKFIPYQSQLPSPGVMYENVTMVPQDINGNEIEYTRYKFYVLKPVLDIFNENVVMRDDDGTEIFKATVVNHNTQASQVIVGYEDGPFGNQVPIYETDYFLDSTKKIKSKSIKVDVNTSLIGQFKLVEKFNKYGQLLSKIERNYISGIELEALASLSSDNEEHIDRGSLSESFQSMKSIFTTNSNDENPVLKNRFLSISTKNEYASVLSSVVSTGPHGKTIETFKKTDPETGAFLIVETERADGKKKRVERVPAYRKYPELGSKTTNPSNRHMLTQEAVNMTSVYKDYQWQFVSANLTSWNKNWVYRDNFGAEFSPVTNNNKIWRKHKSYVYKSSPTFVGLNEANNYFFNWTNNIPINNNWLKVSEVTRYSNFSSPIETKDVNDNFSASKLAKRQNKVIVSGNSRYTEMYYSGAEYVHDNDYFEGEVKGAQYRTNLLSHTGEYCVKTNNNDSRVFEVTGTSGSEDYYQAPNSYSQTFRPGKYKVSFWGYNENSIEKGTVLLVNGESIKLSGTINAGCWKLFNYYFDIPANQNINIHVKNVNSSTSPNGYFYDDFRIHPVSSSITSYVYDHKTDGLVSILDNNNLGKTFKYDDAGRLIATYVETTDAVNFMGGFKISGQFKQNYKGTSETSSDLPLMINNCFVSDFEPIDISVEPICLGSFENVFKTSVNGGSGNLVYQYKWLIDQENNLYSNYTIGSNNQSIPFAIKYCNNNSFDKVWDFIVKITDQVTGKVEEKQYSISSSDCQYIYNNEANIEVGRCSSGCNSSLYNFRIHLNDNNSSDSFKYEFAYFNPDVSLEEQNFIDISSTGGKFCPIFKKVNDVNCEISDFRDFLHIVYRVTNLSDAKVYPSVRVLFFGECSSADSDFTQTIVPDIAKDYLKEGYMIKLDKNDNIIEIIDVNKIVK